MKKLLAVLLVAVLCFALCACGGNNNDNDNEEIDVEGLDAFKIGILSESGEQQRAVFETMYSRIAAKGYRMDFVEFDSANEALDALAAKEIDVTIAAVKSEFEQYSKEHPETLLNLGAVYYEPYGLYLCNFENLEEVADGAKIAVPSDAEGMTRALLLLESFGYIEVDDENAADATLDDVAENSRKFEIFAQPADEIAANLESGEADMLVMSSDSAREAGYKVNRYAVAIEGYGDDAVQPCSTVLLINKEDIASQKHKDISTLYYSPMMYENIGSYIGSYILPAFSINVKG